MKDEIFSVFQEISIERLRLREIIRKMYQHRVSTMFRCD